MRACEQCGVQYPDAVRFCPRDGARLGPEPEETGDPLLGSTIDGRYIIESLLGKGGMGFVYAARHAIIDKRVAIKVLRADTGQEGSAAERFIVEAKAASKIGHPNIVDITDFGVLSDGQPYFVMEYLDGPTLGKLLASDGHIDPRRMVGITAQVARGLLAAHQKGIVHRDLKPDNIFVLEREGQADVVKIVDFGIARDVAHTKRLTVAGMVLGTPEYMSPEQATGQPADHRVDIYALGCIMYEMLTGDVPFRADTATKTLTKHVFDPVIPPREKDPEIVMPESLERAVMRTLEKKSADRYPSLKDLLADLDAVDAEMRPQPAQRAVPMRPSSPTELVAADVRPPRNRTPLYAVGGIAAIAAIVGVGFLVQKSAGAHTTETPTQPIAAVAPNTPPPSTPPPTTPAAKPQVEIALRTEPPGADIFVGDELLGQSPKTVKYDRGTQAVAFVFRRQGYRDASRSVVPDRDIAVDMALQTQRTTKPKSPHTTTAKNTTTTTTTKVTKGNSRTPGTTRRPTDLRNPFD